MFNSVLVGSYVMVLRHYHLGACVGKQIFQDVGMFGFCSESSGWDGGLDPFDCALTTTVYGYGYFQGGIDCVDAL